MEITELSLAPTHFVKEKRGSGYASEAESYMSRKRKIIPDRGHGFGDWEMIGHPVVQASVDLQVRDPLPSDWEQCLDLESGKMYYINRKTSRKSWNWPKDQKLDLELHISSTFANCRQPEEEDFSSNCSFSSSAANTVAMACLNCHLLVILSESSPSCPNCKYVHAFPAAQSSYANVISSAKRQPFSTLSLLN